MFANIIVTIIVTETVIIFLTTLYNHTNIKLNLFTCKSFAAINESRKTKHIDLNFDIIFNYKVEIN